MKFNRILIFNLASSIFVRTKIVAYPIRIGEYATKKQNDMKKNNKTKRIFFRCTEAEYSKIERMAKPYGSISKLLRECLFSKKRVFIDPQSFLQGMNALTTAVNRVGNNVNQIAHFLNITNDVNDYTLMQQWITSFAEYKDILREVRTEIKKTYAVD
jgi:hypothetical protein